mmetsp:Transcript_20669/g.18250  ORF Transcript_20669/g.18250 Transcript_20669/m.18250 type:complete len:174 (+) Transcript_20669:146-667(+)
MKLIDFGVAEIFSGRNAFKCAKQGLNTDNQISQAPDVGKLGIDYDARSADMWQLGMIYYQCMTGQPLYTPEDIWIEPKNGYRGIMNNELKQWLKMSNLLPYFKKNSFDFLQGLLNIDPTQRLTASKCCAHLLFKSYYKKYKDKMNQKIVKDVTKLQQESAHGVMINVSFYKLL